MNVGEILLSQLLTHELPMKFDRTVTGLTLDSRQVRPSNVFFALAGTQKHGEVYIESALQKGAIAVLKEAPFPSVDIKADIKKAPIEGIEMLAGDIPCLSVPHLSQQVGRIAARFYGEPARHKQIIGVTGTNGKTSVTHAIAQLLQMNAIPCGLLGTLGYGIYGALQPGIHTTPDAIRLHALLAQLREVPFMAMEVSSHALVQGRVNGIPFDTAVLTNLSRDHLDYHKTMRAYGEAKGRLFCWPDLKTAVINIDDTFGQSVLANLPPNVTPLTYSLRDKAASVYAHVHAYEVQGCQLEISSDWGEGKTYSPLFGQFNVSNVLAALTVLLNKGFPLSQLLEQLPSLRAVPGRMERFGQAEQSSVIIDYAHTPDALEKTLLALSAHCQVGDLWCVFGCGGDRDRGKRRLMGEVAQRYADKVIITDDNPRHETSQAIIDDILQGCHQPTAVIADREQAIHYALQKAAVTDIILIAGKGHEDYQEIGDQRFPFSDRAIVASTMERI
jgi:UDP-N-acetylmuramoyl-L-alanyl-D-glutamate--2,6-diaminopimelate ligase